MSAAAVLSRERDSLSFLALPKAKRKLPSGPSLRSGKAGLRLHPKGDIQGGRLVTIIAAPLDDRWMGYAQLGRDGPVSIALRAQ